MSTETKTKTPKPKPTIEEKVTLAQASLVTAITNKLEASGKTSEKISLDKVAGQAVDMWSKGAVPQVDVVKSDCVTIGTSKKPITSSLLKSTAKTLLTCALYLEKTEAIRNKYVKEHEGAKPEDVNVGTKKQIDALNNTIAERRAKAKTEDQVE